MMKRIDHKLEKLQGQLKKARENEKAAKDALVKAKENPEIPESMMEEMRQQVAADAAKQATEDLQKQLDAAKREADATAEQLKNAEEKLKAAQKAVQMANPDVAVFQSLYIQLQETWYRTVDAVLIDAYTKDRYEDTVRADERFEGGYVLLGAFQDEENIIPVKLTIKKETGETGNLYVVVAMTKIKRTSVMGSEGTAQNGAEQPLPVTGSIYSLQQIIKNVNTADADFLKYIPDGFLSEVQKRAKQEAISKQNAKRERYLNSQGGLKLRAVDDLEKSADSQAVKNVDFYEIRKSYDADGNGSYTQAEIKKAIDSMGKRCTTEQKAVLWQLATGAKSAKNNPYSTSVGQKIIDAKQAAKDAEAELPKLILSGAFS